MTFILLSKVPPPPLFLFIFWLLINEKVDFNNSVSEILTLKFEFFLCQTDILLCTKDVRELEGTEASFKG